MKMPQIGSPVHFFPGDGMGPYHANVVGLWHGGVDLWVFTPKESYPVRFVKQSESGPPEDGGPFWRWPKEYVRI